MSIVDYQFYIGEKKYVGIDVTSEDAFVVSNAKFKLLSSSDQSVIAETNASTEAITGGYRIKYLLDSVALTKAKYTAVFSFDRDSLEHRIKKLVIQIN